jgi:TonB-dependent SusC/RagA subfamily outer membrane receptor
MKNILIFILASFTFAVLTPARSLAQSDSKQALSYTASLIIPPSADTKKPAAAVSSSTSLTQIFPGRDKINGLVISTLAIESSEPAKKNLAMFKSVKLYLSMGDGSNEVMIGSRDISAKAASQIVYTGELGSGKSGRVDVDQNSNYSTVEQAIMGRVAGVEVLPSGEIRIRGVNNLSGGAPLYVLDGVERANVQGLNPNDIKSVEVLKDASVLSMYGVRGANGVIVIKTRGGSMNSGESQGSMNNFLKGSTIRVRAEYVLRYATKEPTGLNVNITFR